MTGVPVSLENVTKTYRLGDGSRLAAADEVSLELPAGARIAIVGPSGSGKSTLLHLIGAIDRPDEGTITVGDTEVTRLSGRRLADYRARVGFIFQQFHLVPSLTALDNVTTPLVGRKFAGDKRARGRELLAAVGLAGREDALSGQLSGGQQQRVAIARALIADPALILADEPTGNLDSTTAGEILELLGDLHERLGVTMLIATHDESVAALCDHEIRVVDGRATLTETAGASSLYIGRRRKGD